MEKIINRNFSDWTQVKTLITNLKIGWINLVLQKLSVDGCIVNLLKIQDCYVISLVVIWSYIIKIKIDQVLMEKDKAT